MGRLLSPAARKLLFLIAIAGAAGLVGAATMAPELIAYRPYLLPAAVLWLMLFGFLILLSVTHSRVSTLSRQLSERIARQETSSEARNTALAAEDEALRNQINALGKEAAKLEGEASTLHGKAAALREEIAEARAQLSAETAAVRAESAVLQTDLSKLHRAQTEAREALEARTIAATEKLTAELSATSNSAAEQANALEGQAAKLEELADDVLKRQATLSEEIAQTAQHLSVGRIADVEHIAITGALLAAGAATGVAAEDVPKRHHGHALLMRKLFLDSSNGQIGAARQGIHLLEIGTTREKWWPQMSTSRLSATCRALSLNMMTVDVDPRGLEAVAELTQDYPRVIRGKTDFGEKYLEKWVGELPPYIYIDAYDFDHAEHSDERQERYRSLQGDKISDQACWDMHLACAVEFASKCPIGGVVAFDDAFYDGEGWYGKGKTAVPHMLENGFELIMRSESAALFVRTGLG